MTAPRVGVPVPVLYGGIAAIVSLLVAVGYFAGRASNEGAAAAPVAGAAAGAPPVAERAPVFAPAAPPAANAEPAASLATMPGAPQSASVAALQPATAASPAAPPAAPATMALRQEVARYFRQMDATQSAAKTWSDPNALAQQILGEAMKGDSSGFDKLVAASAAARDGVRGIDPPPPCAEHHRLTLALLDEAVTMLSKLRDGIASGDPAAVASIATSGSTLESRAKAVDAMAASLRAQYGVEAAQ